MLARYCHPATRVAISTELFAWQNVPVRTSSPGPLPRDAMRHGRRLRPLAVHGVRLCRVEPGQPRGHRGALGLHSQSGRGRAPLRRHARSPRARARLRARRQSPPARVRMARCHVRRGGPLGRAAPRRPTRGGGRRARERLVRYRRLRRGERACRVVRFRPLPRRLLLGAGGRTAGAARWHPERPLPGRHRVRQLQHAPRLVPEARRARLDALRRARGARGRAARGARVAEPLGLAGARGLPERPRRRPRAPRRDGRGLPHARVPRRGAPPRLRLDLPRRGGPRRAVVSRRRAAAGVGARAAPRARAKARAPARIRRVRSHSRTLRATRPSVAPSSFARTPQRASASRHRID